MPEEMTNTTLPTGTVPDTLPPNIQSEIAAIDQEYAALDEELKQLREQLSQISKSGVNLPPEDNNKQDEEINDGGAGSSDKEDEQDDEQTGTGIGQAEQEDDDTDDKSKAPGEDDEQSTENGIDDDGRGTPIKETPSLQDLAKKLFKDDSLVDTLTRPMTPQEKAYDFVHKRVVTWVDTVFQSAGQYLTNVQRKRTYMRPSRRPAASLPGSPYKTPIKGSRPGSYSPKAYFYIDVSGSMYSMNIDRPNSIRRQLAANARRLADTHSLVIPFSDSLYPPMDVTQTIRRLGGGTDIPLVLRHINESTDRVAVYVIITDCDTGINLSLLEPGKRVFIVTMKPDYVLNNSPRLNVTVIPVEDFNE